MWSKILINELLGNFQFLQYQIHASSLKSYFDQMLFKISRPKPAMNMYFLFQHGIFDESLSSFFRNVDTR